MMIEILINNNKYQVENAITLLKALQQLGYYKPKGIAVAVNNQVISINNWATHLLKANDKVLVITATQGG